MPLFDIFALLNVSEQVALAPIHIAAAAASCSMFVYANRAGCAERLRPGLAKSARASAVTAEDSTATGRQMTRAGEARPLGLARSPSAPVALPLPRGIAGPERGSGRMVEGLDAIGAGAETPFGTVWMRKRTSSPAATALGFATGLQLHRGRVPDAGRSGKMQQSPSRDNGSAAHAQPAALALTAAASSPSPVLSAAMNQSAISLEVTNTVSARRASRSKAFSR